MRRIFLCSMLLFGMGCKSSFFVGEDGEYMIVLDKKIASDAKERTAYTVKNITQEHRFLHGSRVFTIHSRHVYHIGDTFQLFRLDSGKWRGKSKEKQANTNE